jgi:hypothetical protein
MKRWLRFVGQGLIYAGFAAFLGYFSDTPAFEYFPGDSAQIKLSFSHGGQKRECRARTAEELARLAPNMRRPQECRRERFPVLIELEIDGRVVYRESLPPTGITGDGPSKAYRRFQVSAGPHSLRAALRDSGRSDGFDHEFRTDAVLKPRQNLVIDFRGESGFQIN